MSRSKWFIILVSGLVIFGTACGGLQAAKPFAASDPQSVAGNTIAPVASPTRINSATSNPESMADNTVTPVTSATPVNTPIPTPARPEGAINLIEYNEKVANNETGPISGAAEAANQTIQLVFESRAEELILNYVNLSPNTRTMRETELLNNLAEQTVLHGGTGRSDGNYIFQISLIHEINGENVMFTPRLDAEGRPTGVVDEINESALQVLGLNTSDLVFDPNALPILDSGNNVTGWIADFVIPGIEPGRPAGILSRQTPVDGESAMNLIPGNYTPEQAQFFPREVPDGQGEILWYMDSGTIGRVHGYDQKPDLTWQYGVDWQPILSGEALIAEVEANVTVRCDYVPQEVGIIWGTSTPYFTLTQSELDQMADDPNLCYLEEQSPENRTTLNPENPAYRTLLTLATMTNLVVAEYDADQIVPAGLERYRGLTAQEIVSQFVKDGYSADLPTLTDSDTGFDLTTVHIPNLKNITIETTFGSARTDKGDMYGEENGVVYMGPDFFGLVPYADNLEIVWETMHSNGGKESGKFSTCEPIAQFSRAMVLAARGGRDRVNESSVRTLGLQMSDMEFFGINDIFLRVGMMVSEGRYIYP